MVKDKVMVTSKDGGGRLLGQVKELGSLQVQEKSICTITNLSGVQNIYETLKNSKAVIDTIFQSPKAWVQQIVTKTWVIMGFFDSQLFSNAKEDNMYALQEKALGPQSISSQKHQKVF